MEFDNFFTAVLIPPGVIWVLFIGASHFIQDDEKKKAVQKFAHVCATFLFGMLFCVFSLVNLGFPISVLFYVIGAMLIFYSYTIFSAYDY